MTQPLDLEILKQLLPLIPVSIDIQNKIHYIFQNNKFTQLRSIKSLKRLDIGQEAIYFKLREMVSKLTQHSENELREEFQNFLKSLKFKYKKHDLLQYIPNLHDEYKQVPKLEFKQGQVKILQFWANWCRMSINEMQELKRTISTNQQWVGKVEFIGISLDDNIQDWKQRLLDENLQGFGNHYRFPSGWNDDDPALMSLNFKGIPFIVILDNFNRIQYRGHPQDTNVENTVNELILITQQLKQVGEAKLQQIHPELDMEMTDRQFQEMRIMLEEVLKNNMNKYDLTGEEFKVEMIEQNKITHTQDRILAITPIQRSQVIISFEIKIELKDKTEELLKLIESVVPEALLRYTKYVYKDQFFQFRQTIKDILMQHEIEIRYKEIKSTRYYYNTSIDSFKGSEQKYMEAQVITEIQQPINNSQYQQAKQKIFNVLKQLNNFDLERQTVELLLGIDRNFVLRVGDRLEKIEYFEDTHGRMMDSKLVGSELNILIVIYWSIIIQRSRTGINNAIDLVLKNKWNHTKRKVKIFALCMDAVDDIRQCLEGFNLDVMQNVEFGFCRDRKVSTELYEYFTLPYYIVADNNNNIRDIGAYVKLELAVTDILSNKPLVNMRAQEQQQISISQSQALKEYLESNKYHNILNQLGDSYVFFINVTLNEEIKQNKTYACYSPVIHFKIRENKFPVLEPIINAITSIIPKHQLIQMECLLKTIDVPFPGKQCHLCNKHLNKDMQQYYQPFDKYFLCCECAEFDDKSKVGLARYKCSDTLIFINAPLADLSVLKDIDEHKIGKNLKIPAGDPGSQYHSICYGCEFGQEGPRYIAANCLPGDIRQNGYVEFCSQCFHHLKNKESDEAMQIIERNNEKEFNLTPDCVFVRILFNIGYYDF